jgi:tripartite-type tricarboxylate transporter receptor subunit TctC
MNLNGKILGAAVAASLGFGVGSAARADAVADFYKGKRMTMYIGYSSGGGYDRYARVLARYMGRHIPGTPSFLAKNQPGAGSMRLANELYNTITQDGTAIATVSRGIPAEVLQGNKKARYEPRKFNWIGSANNETSTCVVWHTSTVKGLQDFLNQPLVLGGTGPSADTDVFPKVLNNVIGTRFKIVTGYPGGNDINLALERGEVQGRCGWSWSSVKSTRAKWLKEGKIRVMLAMSVEKNDELKDVPFIMDLAKTDRDRKILELIFSRQAIGRPFLAGPKVPADRVKALRAAFMATMKDKDFLKEADKSKLEITPISGEAVQKLIGAMFDNPPDLIAAANEAATNEKRTEVAQAVIPVVTVSGKITKVQRKGARVSWKGDVKKGKLRVGKETKVMVGGKKAKPAALAEGMSCDFKVKGVETALEIACK